MKPIIIYGAGGFGREILCLIQEINTVNNIWEPIGFIDDNISPGKIIKGLPVLGGLNYLKSQSTKLAVVFAISNPNYLKKIYNEINNINLYFPNLISPGVKLYEAETFKLGKGNIIINGSKMSCDVSIGDFNLINGSVVLGHDVIIGNYNMINSGTRISGNVVIKDLNFFGLEVIVLQGIEVGSSNKFGVRSVITKNTGDNYFYFGNPAKKIEPINDIK